MKSKLNDNISIGINCYTIRFRKKGERTKKDETPNYLSIKEATGEKKFTEIINDFIKYIDTNKAFENETKSRVLFLQKL